MWLLALVLAALVLASCGDSSSPKPAAATSTSTPVPAASDLETSRHALNDCSRQSGADFPAAFTSPQNVVVGPLVLIGATYTDAATVGEFGGNKFPLLVRAGHTATMALAPEARRFAAIGYGPLPEGETKLGDAYHSATFIACGPGESHSRADGDEVTFWSGFMLSRRPACLPLDISVDGGTPKRIGLALGKRC